jgi:hypothetical protein
VRGGTHGDLIEARRSPLVPSTRGPIAALLFLLLSGPSALSAQVVRGRVLDTLGVAVPGALVELSRPGGGSVASGITSPTGVFLLTVSGAGSYRLRVAAIGFLPRTGISMNVGGGAVSIPDIVLRPTAVTLPELEVVAHQRFCGNTGVSDRVFSQLLESARTALQVIEATIRSQQVAFVVKLVNTKIYYGRVQNLSVADTTLAPLASWPVQSIDLDSLQQFGFSRTRVKRDEGSRVYYGPDARVMFAPWFLDNHCFALDRVDRGTDTLHLRFTPRGKPKEVDIQGELVLDRRTLALYRLTFSHVGLPHWIPDQGSGGEMQFVRLPSGLWVTWSWAIWAPIAGISVGSDTPFLAGLAEARGWVERMVGTAAADSTHPPP